MAPAKSPPARPDTDEFAAAIEPKAGVEIPELDAVAWVYPIGAKHIETYATVIGPAMALLSSLPSIPKGATAEERKAVEAQTSQLLMSRLIPFVLSNGLGLVKACVTMDPTSASVDRIPHWRLPLIIKTWLRLSFNSPDKWRPWVDGLEELLEATTGTRPSILETFSSLSSRVGTVLKTSSTDGAPAGRTGDGVSRS